MVGQVELKTVGVLVDDIQGGAEAPHRVACHRGVPPNGGTLLAIPEGVRVFEDGVDPFFRRQARFEGKVPAVQPVGVSGEGKIHAGGREEAAIGIGPGAKFPVRKAQVAEFFALEAQFQFVIVLFGHRPRVHGHDGGFVQVGCEMGAFDAAERPDRGLVLLFEAGAIAAGEEAAGGELNPVVVGVCAALEHLLRGQGRGSGRRRIGGSRRNG